MPETCENWLRLVNSCISIARQTREIYQVLPYSAVIRRKRMSEIFPVQNDTIIS